MFYPTANISFIVYALVHLLGQVVMSIWYIVNYTVVHTVPFCVQMMLMGVMNVICLSGPICLFITRQVCVDG